LVLKEQYRPPFWLFSSHLQGPLGLVLRKRILIQYRSETVIAVDGAHLSLKWATSTSNGNSGDPTKADAPVMLILPGLTGGSDKQYITHMVDESLKRGWRSAVIVFPGCLVEGDEIHPCKTPRFYSSSDPSDLQVTINHIHRTYPKAPIVGIGHSMGGAYLMKYLAKEGKDSKLHAVVTISNPWNLQKVVTNLEQPLLRRYIYNPHFTKYWKDAYQRNRDIFKSVRGVDDAAVTVAKSIRELDDRFTKHVYGYETVDQYYDVCSCDTVETINNVSTPMLIIHAEDDPVVPDGALPVHLLRANPHILLALTKSGGHTGWLEGFFPSGLCFADRLCFEYIEKLVQEGTLNREKLCNSNGAYRRDGDVLLMTEGNPFEQFQRSVRASSRIAAKKATNGHVSENHSESQPMSNDNRRKRETNNKLH